MKFVKFPFSDFNFLCVGEISEGSDYWIFLLIPKTNENADVWKFDNSGMKEIEMNGSKYLLRPLSKFTDNESTELFLHAFACYSSQKTVNLNEVKATPTIMQFFKNLFK